MPSDWKQLCQGFASHRWYEDGAIEVDQLPGSLWGGFPQWEPGTPWATKITSFWEDYGAEMTRSAQASGIPVSWVVAIIAIESGGDPWACSPCVRELNGELFCSLAPGRCGGGVASDGKTYSCCAYGLMQIIDSNARAAGLSSGAELLGNPGDSIRIGTEIFRAALAGGAAGDPIVAARMYNGCRDCGGGRAPCTGTGIFGIGGQGDYATKFAFAANTFLALELPPAEPAQSKLWPALKASALFALGAAVVGGALYVRRARGLQGESP